MSFGSGENGRRTMENKYNGVRRRKWGKWVSEIRVPGTQERLWLGTYATSEAAAMAHDVAFYCLRRPSSSEKLNFPAMLPSYCVKLQRDMSPRSVQKAASDSGMAVDAHSIAGKPLMMLPEAYEKEKNDTDYTQVDQSGNGFWWEAMGDDGTWQGTDDRRGGEELSISVEDYLNF